jgi:hypothetical protein
MLLPHSGKGLRTIDHCVALACRLVYKTLRMRQPRSFLVFLVAILGPLTINSANGQEEGSARAYKLKIAYIYNFTRYVTWPPQSFSDPHAPFVIGILGSDPFGAAIDALAKSKKVDGRTIVIKRFGNASEYTPCHILFVAGSGMLPIHDESLQLAKNTSVLLIGETSAFTGRGATVSFYDDVNGTIGFNINIDSTKRQNLTFQAPVLKLANVVHDTPTGPAPSPSP